MKHALFSCLVGLAAGGGLLSSHSALAQRSFNNYDLTTLGTVSTSNNGYNTYLPNGRPEDNGTSFHETTPPEAYLSVNWQPGILYASHGGSARVPAIRYNLKYNLLELRDSTTTGAPKPIPLERLQGFTLLATPTQEAQRFTAVNFQAGGNRARTFMRELHPAGSKLQLLAWYRYAVVAARTNAALGVETQPGAVVQEVLLMARTAAPDAPATPVALDRKAVLRLFGAQAPQMQAYAQDHHLRFEDPNHVVDLVSYYNSQP